MHNNGRARTKCCGGPTSQELTFGVILGMSCISNKFIITLVRRIPADHICVDMNKQLGHRKTT